MSLAIAAGCGGNTNQPERGVAVGGTGGGAIETGGGLSSTGGTLASSATGGSSVQGGAAGSTQGGNSTTGGAAACVNADCVAAHSDPYTCINGQCIPLLTADCPVLLPEESAGQYSAKELLKKPAPIIVGGFASMSNASNPNSAYFHQTQVASGSTTVAAATTSVQTYPPHIIVALGTSEFSANILPQIENSWATTAPGQMRPFYVMSQLLYNTPGLSNALRNPFAVENRLVGFNYAGLKDSHTRGLYDAYYARLVASYNIGGALANSLASTENMYDAAYYLLYSIAAAEVNRKPSDPITGTNVLTGLLEKVIKSSAAYQDTGASNLSSLLTQLQGSNSQFSMALWGVGGPPNFDTTTGTRTLSTSAWCMNYDATLSPPAYVYAADGLIFDPTNQTFTAPAGGVPTCLQKY